MAGCPTASSGSARSVCIEIWAWARGRARGRRADQLQRAGGRRHRDGAGDRVRARGPGALLRAAVRRRVRRASILRGLRDFGVETASSSPSPTRPRRSSFTMVDDAARGAPCASRAATRRRARARRAAARPARRRRPAAGRRARAGGADRRRRARQGARHPGHARRAPPGPGHGRASGPVRRRHRLGALRRRDLAHLGHQAQPDRATRRWARAPPSSRWARRARSGWRARRWCARGRCDGRRARQDGRRATCSAARSPTALLHGWSLDARLPFANAAAGLNCRHLGGVGGIPSLAEVLRAAGLPTPLPRTRTEPPR